MPQYLLIPSGSARHDLKLSLPDETTVRKTASCMSAQEPSCQGPGRTIPEQPPPISVGTSTHSHIRS